MLFTTEVNDNEIDFVGMDIKDVSKLMNDELERAYNRLAKASRVVYTGSISHIINKIDYKKAALDSKSDNHHSYKIHHLNDVEQHLFDELKELKEKLDKKELMYGMWDILNDQGSIPNSREGGSACVIDNDYYIFGGFSRDIFNDIRVLDLNQ